MICVGYMMMELGGFWRWCMVPGRVGRGEPKLVWREGAGRYVVGVGRLQELLS